MEEESTTRTPRRSSASDAGFVEKPKDWQAVRATRIPIEGDALKRAPAGFDPDHAFIEDLKRKDYHSMMKGLAAATGVATGGSARG